MKIIWNRLIAGKMIFPQVPYLSTLCYQIRESGNSNFAGPLHAMLDTDPIEAN